MKKQFLAALLLSGNAIAGNFAECILDKMPGVSNTPAVYAVNKTCGDKYPERYMEIKQGSALGWLGFETAEACTIKKSRDTSHQGAAGSIARACRCLYQEPSFETGVMCAYPDWNNFIVTPPK